MYRVESDRCSTPSYIPRHFDQTAVNFVGPLQQYKDETKTVEKVVASLYLVWRLDTDTFLNAFTRLTSRRRIPKKIVSDCGTEFIRAVNELKEPRNKLDKEKIQRVTTYKGVKRILNPPAAPHFGDVHEVMVKLAKRAIYGVLGDSEVTDETSFSGVESLMNSRPLTY